MTHTSTTRRTFLTALAGVPVLAAGTQKGAKPIVNDPVLAQVLTDLRELSEEARQPSSRKAALRGIETALAVEAAHLGTHYDSHFKSSVKRRIDSIGRSAFIEEAMTHARGRNAQTAVTPAMLEDALSSFFDRGAAGSLRDLQSAVRRARINLPDVQRIGLRPAQFDYCLDLQWQIQMVEMLTIFLCGVMFIEPTPFGEAGCAALTFTLGYLLLVQMLICSW